MFKRLRLLKNKFYKRTQTEALRLHALNVLRKASKKKLQHLPIAEYQYDPKLAVEELGIEHELVMQLLDDYVAQTIKAIVQFQEYIDVLQNSQNSHEKLDYTHFKELAHKNLGVARNLRIKDAELLLEELMKQEDIEYLIECLEALKACAIRLSPECAYDTLKLIEVKNTLLKDY